MYCSTIKQFSDKKSQLIQILITKVKAFNKFGLEIRNKIGC